MHINRLHMPAGVWVLAFERALTGLALVYAVYALSLRSSSGLAIVLVAFGMVRLATAVGIGMRKRWGWRCAVSDTVCTIAAGIVGVSYGALAFPPEWGRVWLAVFIVAALAYFAALVALLFALVLAQQFFQTREHSWRVEKWDRAMKISVVILLLIELSAGGIALRQYRATLGSPHAAYGREESLAYCETIEPGVARDSCFTQVAVAAAARGDALPPDFCARVSLQQPQLKFLCIAYARQIESCAEFALGRERALCRALVSGNVQECEVLEAAEQEVCVNTVSGYLEEAR